MGGVDPGLSWEINDGNTKISGLQKQPAVRSRRLSLNGIMTWR